MVMIYHGTNVDTMTTFEYTDDYYTQNIKVSVTKNLLDLGFAVFAPSAVK
jgi:hypothetical protein